MYRMFCLKVVQTQVAIRAILTKNAVRTHANSSATVHIRTVALSGFALSPISRKRYWFVIIFLDSQNCA